MKYCRSILFLLFVILISCHNQNDKPRQTQSVKQPASATPDTASINAPEQEPQTPDSAFLIIPGEKVGQIALGMSAEKVNSLLGKPDSGDAAMGKSLSFWISKSNHRPPQYVAIYTTISNDASSQHLVRQVQVTSPRFQTTDSIHTGDMIEKIRASYTLTPVAYFTNKYRERVFIFDDEEKGIAFEVTAPDSMCTAITVHRAGEKIKQTYLPVRPDMVRL